MECLITIELMTYAWIGACACVVLRRYQALLHCEEVLRFCQTSRVVHRCRQSTAAEPSLVGIAETERRTCIAEMACKTGIAEMVITTPELLAVIIKFGCTRYAMQVYVLSYQFIIYTR